MKAHLATQVVTVLAAGVIRKSRGVTVAGAEITVPGALARGIAMDAAAASGELIGVATQGEVPVESGGTFSAGAVVMFDDEGRAVSTLGGAMAGVALEASTGAGEFPRSRLLLVPAGQSITETITAAAGIAAGQAVGFDNGPTNSSGEPVKGIAIAAALTGELCFLVRSGSAYAISGAAYALGAALQTDAQGRLITLAAGSPCGLANEAAAGADLSKSVFVK